MGVVQREQGERARFPWFQTPNMDRLAAEGVRFRNAFVTLSLCAPSRAAFLTGRYNHLNGVANNHTPFPDNNVTHASLLRAAGYATAYIGKWHMGGQRGQRPGLRLLRQLHRPGQILRLPLRDQRQAHADQRLGGRRLHRLRHRVHEAAPRQAVLGRGRLQGLPRAARSAGARQGPVRRRDARARCPTWMSAPSTARAGRRPEGQGPGGRHRRQGVDHRPQLLPLHLGRGRQPRPPAQGARRPGPGRGHGGRLRQRQRLLPGRARPGRQALRLRGIAAHPAAACVIPGCSRRARCWTRWC